MTLEELKALYAEKGATTPREEETEQGTKYYNDAVQYGDGWTAFENDNRKIIDYIGQGMDATPVYDEAPKTLGGFTKREGDYVTDYDLTGNAIARRKIETNEFKRIIQDLGPLAMAAITMGGGAGVLGNSLFGLTGAGASAAGGALAGGINAYGNDQDILKGALMGGAGSAGALQLGDTGFTLGDATKALNFAQNPTLAGALNIASPYIDTNFNIGDTGYTANDVIKGLNTVQALGSGNNQQIFNAITGLAKGADGSGLNADELAQIAENREIKRLNTGEPAPSQDPYANIKSMEEVFGGDIGYKLRALGAPQNLASADIDALTRLLRNQNG